MRERLVARGFVKAVSMVLEESEELQPRDAGSGAVYDVPLIVG